MKLLSISNTFFPWTPIDSKLKVISILKNMKKTVIFLIFADIKRHNFKYTGRLLIKFGHNNIGSLGFGMHSSFIRKYLSLDIIPPLKLIQ